MRAEGKTTVGGTATAIFVPDDEEFRNWITRSFGGACSDNETNAGGLSVLEPSCSHL